MYPPFHNNLIVITHTAIPSVCQGWRRLAGFEGPVYSMKKNFGVIMLFIHLGMDLVCLHACMVELHTPVCTVCTSAYILMTARRLMLSCSFSGYGYIVSLPVSCVCVCVCLLSYFPTLSLAAPIDHS